MLIGFSVETLSAVSIDKEVPKPYCCFEKEPGLGLHGEYGIASDPIEVLDSKTLSIAGFSYKASRTPDGWFFAGQGDQIDQMTGKKALIVGKDEPHKHCAMKEDISNQDFIIRLAGNQTIYDIEWLSVFCYRFSHDFGHIELGLVEDEYLVPPFIPEVRESAPQRKNVVLC
ncbi:unnamed protein product [Caenorhabditis auriculariae]|uniref:DM13 domain-containing protein n=1 Tax=Caenorhabditis auriculariae TaxID=2777116 RepID=A0A8S1GZG8_9PELO|nr:unnamed protein product [Caenorhabditis auriculariae]